MRINFILPFASLSGGIQVIAIHAARLAARGHEVTVVSVPQAAQGRSARLRSALRSAVRVASPREPSYFDSLPVKHIVLPSHRPIRDADVPDGDVAIATWWRTAEWLWALSPSKGVKVHLVQGHEVFPEQPIERVRAAYRLPIPKITIARWLVDVLRDEYGFADVPLVPNAVDHDVFHAPPRGRRDRPTVGFLYSVGAVKGLDVILRAVESVRSRIPGLHVVTFGLAAPVAEFPLPPGAEFTLRPSQQKIREIYSGLDLWICGSRSEGFHLMPLEAMACRTPVVSTRVGGATETVRDGVNGYLVAIDDAAALGERAAEILSLPDAAWRRFSDGAASVANEFSWDRSSELLERTIQDVVSRQEAKSR